MMMKMCDRNYSNAFWSATAAVAAAVYIPK